MTDSSSLHERPEQLQADTLDRHRGYRSLIEELEAIDWYSQRIDAAADDELKAVLAHNANEEREHAAMMLEWVRRRDPVLDRYLRTYLFTNRPLRDEDSGTDAVGDADLGIGDLKSSLRTTK